LVHRDEKSNNNCPFGVSMSDILEEIYRCLAAGGELVLAAIVEHHGSTPRTAGAKMIVYDGGASSGTIGGGAVEAAVIEAALKIFQTKQNALLHFDLSRADNLAALDLICGGRVQILLEYISNSPENVELYRATSENINNCTPFFWVTTVHSEDERLLVERSIEECVQANGKGAAATAAPVQADDGRLTIREQVLPAETLYIVGAGHVGQAIGEAVARLDFTIVVFDDRAEFANTERFPAADEIRLCPGYAEVFAGLATPPDCFIVIVTRGHRFDKEVLSQALRTEAGYIGMIGSRKKRDTIFTQLLTEGFTKDDVIRVFCPIGIAIGAETPEEIAISVAAELIDHRARRRRRG
jgi:xanthine dehydrogenase accessory factor